MIVATPPPAKVAAILESEHGVEGARCTTFRPINHTKTYFCAVKVRSGCVAALFQLHHGELGWFDWSARPVTCWKSPGGPTS